MLVNKKAGLGKDMFGISGISLLLAKKNRTILISIIAGISTIIVILQISQIMGIQMIRDVGMIMGVMIIIMPVVMRQLSETRRRDSVDRNLPIFLLTLVSAVQSGSSLLRAVEEAANRNMGSLTPELKNLRANISWGMPYHEAFDNFTKKVGTRLAQRVGVLLQISMDIGGDIGSTLDLIQKHVTEMQNIEKERKSSLAPYIYTIYISFVVFLVITVLLVDSFFAEIEVVQDKLRETAAKHGASLGLFASVLGVNVPTITGLMFNMSLIEAIFGGIAAGKIGEGSFMAGIKHVIIMIILAVVVFSVVGAV